MRRAVLATAVASGLLSMLAFAPSVAAADMAAVGTPAPKFTLPDQDNKPVSLSNFKGKWVVLYFYPKDQTAGCSKEAHNFQRDEDKYKALNAVVLGVSLDTVESHATWCTKDGFSFKMLADPEHKVVDLYGVPLRTITPKDGSAPFPIAERDTFLISPQGKIVKEWKVADIENHSDEVQAAIKADGK